MVFRRSVLRNLVMHSLAVLMTLAIANPSAAEDEPPAPVHAIAMHGEPALPPDFQHFPYANPDAPRGGAITYGVIGTFDSLNPFILSSMRTTARGMWDPEFGKLVFEPLMTRSADEPFTLYGLLAETVILPSDRKWMEFNLNPEAKWSDGQPVTPEDVIFTYELLKQHGRPPFSSRMDRIERIEKTGQLSVRFTFNSEADREFPLIVAGFTPVLPAHATDVDSFSGSTLTPLVGSGPYLVADLDPGKQITYRRRDDYWGKDLPVNRGHLNFDEVSIEYFRSAQTRFEAFKKGLYDIHQERDPSQWERAYEFPAVKEGRIRRESFETRTPATMLGFVFNTRRAVFSDRRVREALSLLFDFEWANRNLYFGIYERTGSFWHGSALSALGKSAGEIERELLAEYPDAVRPDIMDGTWKPPASDGSGRDRAPLRAAFSILREAGYRQQDGVLVDRRGNPLAFEILTRTESEEKLAIAYKRSLDRIGAQVSLRSIDDAQYQRRSQEFDYDMIISSYSASLSPGVEQRFRWGSQSRDLPGSFNFAGAALPAIDAMIEAMLSAVQRDRFEAAVRALDRVLLSQHYIVPLFHLDDQLIAYWSRIAHPETIPVYGNQYPVWWYRQELEQ